MRADRILMKQINFIDFQQSTTKYSYEYRIDISFEIPKAELLRMPKSFIDHMDEAISNTILRYIDLEDFIVENMQGLA